MARRRKTKRKTRTGTPQLCTHSVRGQLYSYATFNGEIRRYGRFDDEARRLFEQDLATWLANGRRFDAEPEDEGAPALTVADVTARYLEHVQRENSADWLANNEPRLRLALEGVADVFGRLPAEEFGPKRLKALQAHLCEQKRADQVTPKLNVATINERVRIVVAAFRWAVSEELLPPSIYEGLRAVEAVKATKPGVRGRRRILPVPREHLDAVLPFLNRPVAAIVELLWLTGCRPSELLELRPCDIDRSKTPWKVRLEHHKNAHRGHDRVLHFGPQAQRILAPFLVRPPTRPLFRPAEGMADTMRRRRQHRQSKVWDSHAARYEREKAARERQEFCETYDAPALRKAVVRAVARANRERAEKGLEAIVWSAPYAMRHSHAETVREALGIEAAAAALGHSDAATTAAHYLTRHTALAAKVAEQLG